MHRLLTGLRRSEEEYVKDAGFALDFDEIAKKGAMSTEETQIAKWYGVYATRHPGSYMARVVVPGGVLTATQARVIADAAEAYALGRLALTTRQSIQLHWLKLRILPELLRALGRGGLSTFHGCGDVTRNVTACPLAERCAHRLIDVRPFARRAAARLGADRDLDNLPRKFKISWSGCAGACAQPYLNCLGLVAVVRRRDGEVGFRAVIGGGMGWEGFVAQELFSFVPPDRAVALCRAVALLFRDHGDRYDRSRARLKYVVQRSGVERCRALVLELLAAEGVATEGLGTAPDAVVDPPVPERPLVDGQVRTRDGSSIVRVRVPKGELSHQQLRRVAELSERYGDQRLYTTNRQNLELQGVAPERVEAARAAVEALGLSWRGVAGLADLVCCVGTTYCPKAVSGTRDLYDLLVPIVESAAFAELAEQVTIAITGCPNSCAPYRIADLGFRGMRLREEVGSVEAYQVVLGGDQRAHGRVLGEYQLADCPEVVRRVLARFRQLRAPGETLRGCVERCGIEPWREAVDDES